MRYSIRALICTAALAVLHAQEPPAPTYKYDVVSIRRADPAEMNSGFSDGAQGGMKARNVTVLEMLSFAYSLRDYQFEGVPGWAKSERFEVSFTPDRTEIVLDDKTTPAAHSGWIMRQRERLKAVLHDRFNVALRSENKDLPVYALTVARNGPKLHAPAHPERTQTMNINRGQQLIATTATMKSLADALSHLLGRPVRDETGLDATYDFTIEWDPNSTLPMNGPTARPQEPSSDPGRSSIFTAITQQLGLRLDSKKASVQVLVIEKLNHPTEN